MSSYCTGVNVRGNNELKYTSPRSGLARSRPMDEEMHPNLTLSLKDVD